MAKTRIDIKDAFKGKDSLTKDEITAYIRSIYINNKCYIVVTCPKHGDFKIRADHHSTGSGCKYCNKSIQEKIILNYLKQKNIIFETQKTFEECINIRKLPFDFFLPEYNMCIEFDGKQHFESIKYWGGDEGLILRKLRDKIKTNYCLNNNIKLIRIRYDENIIEKLYEII